ncbi:MAG: hypothetical protein ACJAXJ_003897 [Colwellia sp.]
MVAEGISMIRNNQSEITARIRASSLATITAEIRGCGFYANLQKLDLVVKKCPSTFVRRIKRFNSHLINRDELGCTKVEIVKLTFTRDILGLFHCKLKAVIIGLID